MQTVPIIIVSNYRLNGKECVVHYVQKQIPPKGATIIVKHSVANSTTGILNKPFFWRLQSDNTKANKQVTHCFRVLCQHVGTRLEQPVKPQRTL